MIKFMSEIQINCQASCRVCWWFMPAVPAFRMRQEEHHKSQAGYRVSSRPTWVRVRLCLNKTKAKINQQTKEESFTGWCTMRSYIS